MSFWRGYGQEDTKAAWSSDTISIDTEEEQGWTNQMKEIRGQFEISDSQSGILGEVPSS